MARACAADTFGASRRLGVQFEDAIDDCTSCTSNCNEHSTNSDSVHAWDEGVAFYTGSLEGTAYGGNSNGKLLLPALKPQT